MASYHMPVSWFQQDAHTSLYWKSCWGPLPQAHLFCITHQKAQAMTSNGGSELLAAKHSLGKFSGPCDITDHNVFSDANSGVGIAVIISNRWRAWNLLPGWNSDGRDIGWAKGIGSKLLVQVILASSQPGQYFRVFRYNKGIIKGWWKERSQNRQTDIVFRWVHNISAAASKCTIIMCYITSKNNPADAPSWGIYLPTSPLPSCPNPNPRCHLAPHQRLWQLAHSSQIQAWSLQQVP